MTALHIAAAPTTRYTRSSASASLFDALVALRAEGPGDDFAAFERRVRALVMELETELLGEALRELDIDAPAVRVGGKTYRQVVRCSANYLTRGGEVRVERSLYRAPGASRAICPMELRAGIVESYWTPEAAALATWAVAHLTPQEASELFERTGGMTPSRSALDRLPKALSERWEEQRPRFEEMVRAGEQVPETAVSVGVSLDGVMVPMKTGQRQEKRAAARAAGKDTRGPAGFREAACGTLSFYDQEGDRVGDVVYLGRMPQKGKRVLKETLEDELAHILAQRPSLHVVGVADGARDNWRWFEEALPHGSSEVLDFFHAAEHLRRALDSAHGENSPKARAEFERLRLLMRDHQAGVDKVINALAYQRRRWPRRKKIAQELNYFRRNRHRMQYAATKAAGMPIGSGVVEAANKTLVTVRMKRSGARWSIEGGQAILTFRSLAKARRFDRAWQHLAGTYEMHVEALPAASPQHGEVAA